MNKCADTSDLFANILMISDARSLDGTEITENNLSDFPVSNELECAQNCQNYPFCVVYSYSKSQHRCWLKSKLGNTILNPDAISGFQPPP